jgi:hypothetical protein
VKKSTKIFPWGKQDFTIKYNYSNLKKLVKEPKTLTPYFGIEQINFNLEV